MVLDGISIPDILYHYPDLEPEDIGQAMAFHRVWETEKGKEH